MEQSPQTLAEALAAYEPAADVEDLDTARRMITALRALVSELEKESEPAENEFTAFLDEDHLRMLELLYANKQLGFGGDPSDPYWLDPPELEEAFSDFVEDALDVVWDMAQLDADHDLGSGITPSA